MTDITKPPAGKPKRPKTMALKASVPTVRSPKVPAARSAPKVPATRKIDFADFDSFTRAAQQRRNLFDRWDAIREDQGEKEPYLSPDEAQKTADLWLSDILRAERVFERHRQVFERDDQYREAPEQENLLGNHTSMVLADRVVSQSVALLIGAFPNANPASPEVFARLAIEEIRAARPSASALEATCRQLRRSAKFLPTISELLAVLREQMVFWEGDIETASQLGIYAEDFRAMHRRFTAGLVEKKKRLAGAEVAAEPADAPGSG